MERVRAVMERGPARFGMLAVRLLLFFAVLLAIVPFEPDVAAPRSQEPATFLWWLPDAWVASRWLFWIVRGWLLLSVLAWAAWIAVPWSGWSTVIAFAWCWALRMENTTHGAHVFHVTLWVLAVHALWFHFAGDALLAARARGELATARLYPRWALVLSVLCITSFHTLAGVTKLLASGAGWANGTSLQLWVDLFGDPRSPLVAPILASPSLARALQVTTLVVECGAVLALAGRRSRYAVGFILIGFYAGILGTFTSFGFHMNALLIAWFMLPVDRLLGLDFE